MPYVNTVMCGEFDIGGVSPSPLVHSLDTFPKGVGSHQSSPVIPTVGQHLGKALSGPLSMAFL